MKKLAKAGIVMLDPLVIDKSIGKPCKKGLHVKCAPCSKHRPCTEGITCLRRPHCDYYYWNHCQNKTHTIARHIFDQKKKDNKDPKTKTCI